jgi:CRP-like cAMP-binding protein
MISPEILRRYPCFARISEDSLKRLAMIAEEKSVRANTTTTKDTELVRIDAAKLRKLCEQDPLLGCRLSNQVAKLLAHRLESARGQLAAV